MKITKVKRNSSGSPCEYQTIEAPIRFDEESELYVWLEITLKTMPQVMLENDCWFDCHGNLCSERGQLAPTHFPDLGRTFHVKKGCGFDTDCDWLRVSSEKYKEES